MSELDPRTIDPQTLDDWKAAVLAGDATCSLTEWIRNAEPDTRRPIDRHHDWIAEHTCPTCQGVYDAEAIGTQVCPICGDDPDGEDEDVPYPVEVTLKMVVDVYSPVTPAAVRDAAEEYIHSSSSFPEPTDYEVLPR